MSNGIYIKNVYIKGLSKKTLESELIEVENDIKLYKDQLIALIVNTHPILKSEYDGQTNTHVVDEGPIRLYTILEEYDELIFRRRMIWEAQADLESVTED